MKIVRVFLVGLGITAVMLHVNAVRAQCDNLRYGWSRNIQAVPNDMTTDAVGSIFIAGHFGSGTVDFDPTDGLDEHSAGPRGTNAFVTKLYSDGTYGWTYSVGSDEEDEGATGVCVDKQGNAYISGSFKGTLDFDPGLGIDLHTSIGFRNSFIATLASDGAYVRTISFQGTGDSGITGIARDPSDALIVAGLFFGTVDFDPGSGVSEHYSVGSQDVFVTKMGLNGQHIWTRTFGGGGFDAANDVGTDGFGNIYIAGNFRGWVDFDPGPGEDWHRAQRFPDDVFVSKYLPDGSYVWTRTLPVESRKKIAVSREGAVHITGSFRGTVDFDPTERVDLRTSIPDAEGITDIFVTKLNSDGSYAWTYTAGAEAQDKGQIIAVEDNGAVLVSGEFRKTVDFDPGPDVVEHTSDPFPGEFLFRLRADGSFGWVHITDRAGAPLGRAMTVDPFGDIITTHWIQNSLDLDPTCGIDFWTGPDCPPCELMIFTKLRCAWPDGDYDNDGDVDLADISHLQNCFAGEAARECDPGCDAFDLDLTASISLADYTQLYFLLTNPK